MPGVIAIFGGAFDPVHCDHVTIGRLVLEHRLADAVWYMPSPDRWDKRLYAAAEHRLAMLHLALDAHPGLVVSDLEVRRGEFRGTYQFLRGLAAAEPDTQFRLVIGADSYATIPRWRDPLHFYGTEFNGEQLLKEFPLIVFARDGTAFPDEQGHREKGFLPFAAIGPEQGFTGRFSSSGVREHLARSASLPPGLAPDVFQYLIKNALY